MSDLEDFAPILVGILIICASIALGWWMVVAEHKELAAYNQRCLTTGFTAAQCAMMTEQKRDTDSAQMSASFAIGMAAGSAGRR